jgi:osmosensitive K+ channel His kinase sensor protein
MRPDTIGQAQGLEIVPHRKIEYRGKTFEEMDTEAVLQRRPNIALVAGTTTSAHYFSACSGWQVSGGAITSRHFSDFAANQALETYCAQTTKFNSASSKCLVILQQPREGRLIILPAIRALQGSRPEQAQ